LFAALKGVALLCFPKREYGFPCPTPHPST
jgi:hypothetical protein